MFPADSDLTALKLARRDLFAGPPPSPAQQAALRAAQEARQSAARAERKARLATLDHAEKLQAVVNVLGAKLTRSPECDALAGLLHAACDRLHQAEIEVDKWYPMRWVSAQDKAETNEQPV